MVGLNFLQKLFIYVMLRLYTEFQCSAMPGTGQKVCGVVVWWCGGGGGGVVVLSLCHPKAVCRVTISYYACNRSTSLWWRCGVVVWWWWCGGVVVV